MKEKFLYNKNMYDFTAGCYCGVVMPEHVMKKIMKLNYQYQNEIIKVLDTYKDELFESDWTLANEMDQDKIKKQVTITFALKNNYDIDSRIKSFAYIKPNFIKNFYVVDNREQASEVAKEILQEEIEKDASK